jgi:hypothetical protein
LAITRFAFGATQGTPALWRATTLALGFRHVTILRREHFGKLPSDLASLQQQVQGQSRSGDDSPNGNRRLFWYRELLGTPVERYPPSRVIVIQLAPPANTNIRPP